MIKVTVSNLEHAKELTEAFANKEYDVEIIVKENTVGQDDVDIRCELSLVQGEIAAFKNQLKLFEF